MVTGAAGSIGSELCHQLARLEPRCLIALDQAESPLFALEADLRKKFPALNLVIEVGDIRDLRQMEQATETHLVDSIFHAAAYKHVPIMEKQVCEAVRNNIIGTWNLLQAAIRSKVPTFVLISTDKAVNPSSVMGLTKRVAELIVTAKRRKVAGMNPAKYLSVRFGNVLVSNGSVVPTFQRQISSGGPVTVTHPEMRRYFMTVQEAAHLVLRASAMSSGGEIFMLEMGKPVRILDLATNMIRLAGFVPGEDIDIRFTGLRPGEKMFEELSLTDEDSVPTSHPRIRALKGRQLDFHELARHIAELQHLLARRDPAAIIQHLAMLVPEYRPNPSMQTPEVAPVAIPPSRTTPAPAFKRATA
jgi:FlaA1/EpsC-like NDP-sugar epimerase